MFDDPELAGWVTLLQCHRQPSAILKHSCLILALEAQHDDSGVTIWGVRVNVCEVQVKRDENPSLALHPVRENLIVAAGQPLVLNALDVETDLTERLTGLYRKVLVRFELHALNPSGRSIALSRASSAA